MVLVGNKTDLHMERRVTTEEGKALAEEMKAVFLETSAKENRVGSALLKPSILSKPCFNCAVRVSTKTLSIKTVSKST